MRKKERNVLIIAASGVIFVALIYTFGSFTLFGDSSADHEATASIISIKKVRDRSYQIGTGRIMTRLTVQLPNGETATAFGLANQLSNCAIGDTVSIRINKQVPAEKSVYRLVSKSCKQSNW